MNSREIERKFTVEGLSYDEAFSVLRDKFNCLVDTTSWDLYWKAPGVDFVRLRENSRELTVKVTDKDTIVDRVEENVRVEESSMDACIRQQTLLYGEPLRLTKKFCVFTTYATILPYTSEIVVCLYRVAWDPKKRLFLEVESDRLDMVDQVVANLYHKFTLTPVLSSLYQIFSEGL